MVVLEYTFYGYLYTMKSSKKKDTPLDLGKSGYMLTVRPNLEVNRRLR